MSAGSQEWLEANARLRDVVTLPSGLQYKVVRAAPFEAKSPLPFTPCECHYRGTLLDGTEFDSSHARGKPATVAPCQVVKGWTEAMQLMGEGDEWIIWLPPSLAYGDRQQGLIPPGSALVFELAMLSVLGDSKPRPDGSCSAAARRMLNNCWQLR